MSECTLKLPRLYPKQYAALFDPKRFSIIEASTKAGKTVGALTWILDIAWRTGKMGRAYWWIAPTFSVAKIAFGRLKRMLLRGDPDKNLWESNDSECFITLKINGACLWFKGADRPDTLYGEDVHGAVVDEATRCKEEAWHALRSTLTATRAPARIIGNVKGRKNWAYNLAQMAKSGEPTMGYHKLTAWDAVEGGVLAKDEIDEAKRVLPEAVFKELYLAEPSDDGGNPFGLAAIKRCVVTEPSTMPPSAYGLDLAKSYDWTWIIGLDSNGVECLSERWQGDWNNTKRKLTGKLNGVPTLADSTGVGDPIVEDLQRTCGDVEGFKFTQQSKQQLMEGLASAIQTQEIRFNDPILISELETFEYEYTRTGVRYTAPDGLHDDGVCALALAHRKRVGSGVYSFTVSAPKAARTRELDLQEVGWK